MHLLFKKEQTTSSRHLNHQPASGDILITQKNIFNQKMESITLKDENFR